MVVDHKNKRSSARRCWSRSAVGPSTPDAAPRRGRAWRRVQRPPLAEPLLFPKALAVRGQQLHFVERKSNYEPHKPIAVVNDIEVQMGGHSSSRCSAPSTDGVPEEEARFKRTGYSWGSAYDFTPSGRLIFSMGGYSGTSYKCRTARARSWRGSWTRSAASARARSNGRATSSKCGPTTRRRRWRTSIGWLSNIGGRQNHPRLSARTRKRRRPRRALQKLRRVGGLGVETSDAFGPRFSPRVGCENGAARFLKAY